MKMRIVTVATLAAFCFTPVEVGFTQMRDVANPDGYEHDHFGTEPRDLFRNFGGFVVSFDSEDDNDGDGTEDRWGIPEWVSHEIRSFGSEDAGTCIPTGERPSTWFTELALFSNGIAPDDATYRTTRSWRQIHKDWYVRGHMAMKFLVERIGNDAAWNTHTVLNAVPQRASFNSRIWQDLENLTGAWAQKFGKVWVITGPIIIDLAPSGFIGDEGEVPVAIPDGLFKIVAREVDGSNTPAVLAFAYPQWGPGYDRKAGEFPHKIYLTSVDKIEEMTGLDFFSNLSHRIQDSFEDKVAETLWEVEEDDFISACRD